MYFVVKEPVEHHKLQTLRLLFSECYLTSHTQCVHCAADHNTNQLVLNLFVRQHTQ